MLQVSFHFIISLLVIVDETDRLSNQNEGVVAMDLVTILDSNGSKLFHKND